MRISKHLFLAVPLCLAAGAAQAGLEICNQTGSIQSVALGFKGETAWSSRGWWVIEPGDCATVVQGDLTKRYYYYRAEVDGGDFAGSNFMFCTSPKVFEVTGNTDCAAQGYDSDSFREIDTGRTATEFTFNLMPGEHDSAPPRSAETGPPEAVSSERSEGLEICNGTDARHDVAIGYDTQAGPVSEGWWVIEPGACALVLTGALTNTPYYYRALKSGSDFEGERSFCTTFEAFTIKGDDNCTARGYDTDGFTVIEGMAGATGFSFDIAAVSSGTGDTAVVTPDVTPDATGGANGIRVCNETADVQSIAFGYETPGGWVSEGWWNIDPDDCTRPLLDGEDRRYLYYRTEVYGGEFRGENYFFCTTPQAFEILGDSECEARGYDREDFRELDTGGTEGIYTLTLSPDTPAEPPQPSEDDRNGLPTEVLPEPADSDSPDQPGAGDPLPPVDDVPEPGPPSFDFTVPDPDAPEPETPDAETPRPVTPPEVPEVPEVPETPGLLPGGSDGQGGDGPPIRRGDTRGD